MEGEGLMVQLSGPHRSKLRNPLIAEAFHRTGAVEVWGRGTNRVITMCRKHGLQPPMFEERQDFLIVTFKAAMVDDGAVGEEGSQKGSQKTSEKIISILSDSPKTTINELAKKLDIQSSAIKKHLRNLKQQGLIRRIGPDKGGYWEVIEK
jgi:ATP-dependent DNA helicase RecG